MHQDDEDICPDDNLVRYEPVYILMAMQDSFNLAYYQSKILAVSFMAYQHGRILQAHIQSNTTLVVSCSEKFSFESNEVAPTKLLYRWLLVAPISVEPREAAPPKDGHKS
ncbi:uncharacterized protein ATNIH1004_003162 [Aspergillus tanneri]|uniref:Uncharacterized protein n=1 Tax=Aspergillus tanneri TaxID=1220188 RepID=A0A5M9MWY1_9EURO|nr:uncharacterized protein ATNIH1004_003162 [Aspergillus tanneri]KAA8650476.1 hypothetical protein ATNIH1004_003162 [Aspergillus tanneri]